MYSTRYAPWPAKISAFTKTRLSAEVYFYGSHNIGKNITSADIIPFDSAYQVIRLLLLRPNLTDFCKGIKEVEIELNIPEDLSITKPENALKSAKD